MNTGSVYSSGAVNTPTVQAGATALARNDNRLSFSIQNQGTNPLFVLFGSGATTSVYHVILKGSTVAADGSGGSVAMEAGTVYNGVITVAGTSPSYTVFEQAP
jgi:hypothetical protein